MTSDATDDTTPAATTGDAPHSADTALRRSAEASFVAMVSHELRTPLNTINGFLEIVLDGHAGPLTAQQREFLGYAQQGAQQLIALTNDLLLLTRADAGQLQLHPTALPIAPLIAEVVSAEQVSIERKGIAIAVNSAPDLPPLYADELRVRQVVGNLLGNALKFTPPGGHITLSVGRWSEGENMALFSVADSGRGVAPEEQERIFARFYQSRTSAAEHGGGYGLGLAIARLIVEQHGGRIWVADAPEPSQAPESSEAPEPNESGDTGASGEPVSQGAIFHFTLPFASSEQQRAVQNQQTARASRRGGRRESHVANSPHTAPDHSSRRPPSR